MIALDAIELPKEFAGTISDASSVALWDGEDTVRRQESALVRPTLLSDLWTGS